MKTEYIIEGGIGYVVITDPLQTKTWYLHNQLHREDGPAVTWRDGGRRWFQHNRLHRIDGPAVIWADGTQEWWIRGEEINVTTQEEFLQWLKLKAFL